MTTDTYWQDLVILKNAIKGNLVLNIDRYGVQVIHFPFQPVQSERGVVRVYLQEFQGFLILTFQIRSFFYEFPGSLQIRLSIAYLIFHPRAASDDHPRIPPQNHPWTGPSVSPPKPPPIHIPEGNCSVSYPSLHNGFPPGR